MSQAHNASTPPNTRIYAIGDIHGCIDQFETLQGYITDDAEAFAGDKHIVYLGDFVDRGRDSKGVVEQLIHRVPRGFAPHYIKGNHDATLLAFLDDAEVYPDWHAFGGAETLRSYGVKPPRAHSLEDFEKARGELIMQMPPEHLNFFHDLELKVVLGDYAFVHAGLRPGIPLEAQSEDDLLWIRGEFLRSSADFGKVVVHGHTPRVTPERKANRISVDTGCYATGVLSCAVLDGAGCRFLQATR